MSTPTFDQSPVTPSGPGRPPVAPPSRGAPSRLGPVRAAIVAAVLGAGAMTGLLFATGAIGDTNNATTLSAQTASGSTGPLRPAALYAKAAGGVVDITSVGVGSSSTGLPFKPPSQSIATGTGIEIDSKGDILTASHVVAGASSITVKLSDGTRRVAKVLGADRATDVAVLKIDPSGLKLNPLPQGSSGSLAVGDPLAVIGDPFNYDRSLSTGVVSAVDRTISAPNGFDVAHAIQTDATINPGNSGGPVLNAAGDVVGVVDQIATGSSSVDSSTGVGFAVPIDVVKSELPQLERGATVAHAYLGAASAQEISQQGALVQSVVPGSPAAAAGLRTGDLVTAVNGTAVNGPNALIAAIEGHKPGDHITLTVQRGSHRLNLNATLATQPSKAPTG